MASRKQESAVNHKLGCLIGIFRMSCCCCCAIIIAWREREKNRGMNLDVEVGFVRDLRVTHGLIKL